MGQSFSWQWVLVPCALAMLAAGCAGGASALQDIGISTGVGGVQALLNRPSFSEADEVRMAQENARKFEAQTKMWNDPLLEAYITEIGQRIVASTKPRPFSYRFQVVADPSVNAFTFGGGLVYVNAGLLARMENEAQLAMVLAHEIGHVTERHVPKGIEAEYGIQVLGQLAASAASSSGVLPPGALEKSYEFTMSAAINGHGRGRETEADETGLDYMVKAGYDPREAPHTFEQLLKEYGDQSAIQNFFYGNHPTNVARIENTTRLVKEKYEADLANRRLIVNTEEFNRRTRPLVLATAKYDYDAKRFKNASALYEKAARIDPTDAVAHYYLGKIALDTESGQGALDRTITELEQATKANPQYAIAHRDLGLAYFRKGDKQRAANALERYLTLEPSGADAPQIKATLADWKR